MHCYNAFKYMFINLGQTLGAKLNKRVELELFILKIFWLPLVRCLLKKLACYFPRNIGPY